MLVWVRSRDRRGRLGCGVDRERGLGGVPWLLRRKADLTAEPKQGSLK
jgi:hypothetical protein